MRLGKGRLRRPMTALRRNSGFILWAWHHQKLFTQGSSPSVYYLFTIVSLHRCRTCLPATVPTWPNFVYSGTSRAALHTAVWARFPPYVTDFDKNIAEIIPNLCYYHLRLVFVLNHMYTTCKRNLTPDYV